MKELNKYLGIVLPSDTKIEPRTNQCLFCGKELNEPLKTISMLAENGDHVTYFYRTHKNCYNEMPGEQIKEYEDSLIDNL